MALPETTVRYCKECPWRRESAAGWLGPMDAMEWVMLVGSDQPIACHETIVIPEDADSDEGSWDDPRVRQCLGAADYRANVGKRPRNPYVTVGEKSAEVFATPGEFVAHHEGGV